MSNNEKRKLITAFERNLRDFPLFALIQLMNNIIIYFNCLYCPYRTFIAYYVC